MVYAKYLAWLNSTPDGTTVSRIDAFTKVKRQAPEMPETFGGEHLIDFLFEIGVGMNGAMGLVPLNFTEIYSWSQAVHIDLKGYEAKAIRDLSRVYVSQLNVSSKADCPAPWVKGVDDIESHNMIEQLKKIEAATKNSKPTTKKKRVSRE